MKKHRSSLIAAALGVVALALVASFAIFLPKSEGSSPIGEDATSQPKLPDRAGDLVALDSGTLPAALQQRIGAIAQVTQAQTQGTQQLTKLYGEPAAYKFYATSDGQSLVAVTVLNRKAGLFAPDGPPVPASGQQPNYQLTRVSGAVCAEYYGQQPSATGQPGGPVMLSRVHCQMGAGGRTYDVDARGLSVAKTVAALKQLADA